ncbi:kinase-like domain-containing protein [Dactylonectria estremocensis]|uniref:Kinase-like domain-containing protein n=1 Tax=Dactylonectria estremocensis TaxID=1079267 RepID=A0A9P9FB80_9HYPO|nr:kinase-like domain-containing protein [Dactylonectria estremocensis]
MDHYRLLSPISRDCRSRHHVYNVIQCAYPPIEEDAEKLFELVEDRGDKTFFSLSKLRQHFRSQHVIENLLECPCHDCKTERGTPSDEARYWAYMDEKPDAWLLLPTMIYLGKLHFIYTWLDILGTETHSQVSLHDVASLRRLLPGDLERNLFKSAYERALKMFSPYIFKIDTSGIVPPKHLVTFERFPFENELKATRQGQFGTLTYFEIQREYVDTTVASRMKAYPSSITGHGITKKYHFARKVLKSSGGYKMEGDMLTMVSCIKSEASENIITLLALYHWRQSIHYVFPHVQTSLYAILRQGQFRDELSHDDPLRLPDHWLWDQMVGVARALKAIHTELPNPFPKNEDKVMGFHFDLKPDNILVTADRKLKITDFGQSVVELFEKDELISTSLNQGDPKYNAPESRLSPRDAQLGPGDEPRDIQVFLNYDVWSLACIMLEVLIFLLDEPLKRGSESSDLQEFDEELNKETPKLVFFGDFDVKVCVRQKIHFIEQKLMNTSPRDEIHDQYIISVCKLMREMFSHNKSLRPHSETVSKRLQGAKKAYQDACRQRGDSLRTSIKTKEFDTGDISRFKEIGWLNDDNKVASFLDMQIVSLKVQQPTQEIIASLASCRIQLLYRPEMPYKPVGKRQRIIPAQFVLKWGVEKEGEQPTVRGYTIDTEHAQLAPKYLYQEDLRSGHQCTLFGRVKRIGGGNDLVITIGFKSRREVEAFQGAVLHHKVIPDFGETVLVRSATWTERPSSLFKPGRSWTTDRPQVQFWAEDIPNYYPQQEIQSTTSGADNLRRPSVASTYSSNTPSQEKFVAMAVFSSNRSLMVLPLNKGDKEFSLEPGCTIMISKNRMDRHKEFSMAPINRDIPWENKELDFTAPNIPLEELLLQWGDDGMKMDRAWIRLSDPRDVELFKRAVRPEWRD